MPANITVIPGAEQIDWYLGNYNYADIIASMEALKFKLAVDLNRIILKNAAGTAFKLMHDASGAANHAAGRVLFTDANGAANTDASLQYLAEFLTVIGQIYTDKLHVGSAADPGDNNAIIDSNLKAKSLAGNGTQTVDAGATNGADEILNGGFDSADNWTVSGSNSISGGKGHLSDPGNGIGQSVSGLTIGKIYRIRFTVGDNPLNFYTDSIGEYEPLGPGTYDRFFTAVGEVEEPTFYALAGGTATIDDVSLVEFNEVILTPTNMAIEISNSQAYELPKIILAAGDLPVNSIIVISPITGCLGLEIETDGDSYRMDGTYYECMLLIKNSIGWRPIRIV